MDIAWGLGFVVIANFVYFRFKPDFSYMILLIVTTIWGLRLAIYLAIRNLPKGEDWRYANWRKDWGNKQAIISFFRVFMLQGSIMWIVALPLMQIEQSYPRIQTLQYIGIAVCLFGFLWESIADWQLYAFKQKKENKGKVMRQGLWKYSRHPNYFGEIVFWWGVFIIAIPHGNWWWSLLGVSTISFFIIKISGVPMLERKKKKEANYQTYIEDTNALIPNFFKR